MGVPLATAFVRVRPDTSGFERETERDVSHSGDKAGGSFAGSFNRSLSGKAAGLFASLRRNAEQSSDGAGDGAAGSFAASFGRRLSGSAAGLFAAFRRTAEQSTDGAGAGAGGRFGDDFVRDAAGRLRDARGRFVTEGSLAGAGFGDGFVRDAAGRLRDLRGRFAAEGRGSGDGFSSAFRAGTSSAQSGLSGLIAVGIALGPAIIPVAAAAAASISGIAVAAAAAFAAVGVGVLAFSGITAAVQAMGAAEGAAAKDSAALARSHAAVASAADGVRNAEQSLARTREQVADSNAAAARRVTEAETQLTRAQRDARDIALQLNEARQQAKQRLDDLNQSVQENALSQRQSNLDIARAKAELDRVLADPRATAAQREQARITYEREVLQLTDLQRRGKELAADQALSTRAGVEGSKEVAAARQRIADADDRVRAAQQSVTDARREQQKQERDGAYQIRQAMQQLVSAQRALGQATVATGASGSAAMTKLKQAMEGLSPAGQRFAKFLFGLKDEFRRVRDAAQEGLLPGVQTAIENLLPYLPQVEKFVGGIGKTMGDLAVRASKAFTSPFWKQFFGFIGKTASPALTGMFEAAGNVGRGFASILQAFAPLNADVGKGIVGLTEKFAAWAASLSSSKGFQSFLAYVREFGPIAVKFFGDLFVVVGKLLVALAPMGAVLLTGLGKLAGFLAGLDPGVLLGIAAAIGVVIAIAGGPVVAAVVGIVALIGGVYYVLNRLGLLKPLIAAISAGVSWAWENVLKPAFNGLKDVILNQVVPAVLWLWQNVIKPAFNGISAAVSWAWENVIKPVFGALRVFVADVLAPLFTWFWQHVIQPVWTGIKIAISVAWAIIKVIFGLMQIYIKVVLAPIFTWLWNNVIKPVWNGIKATISGVWENGLKPIFNAIGGFIEKYVVPGIKSGVTSIGKAWDRIKDVAKIPVKFVVDTVINGAIIDTYNKIAGAFGVDKVDRVTLPKGFARGGVLPGYTPGKDVHRFVSPTGGALDLSGGEGIIRPEGTRALGKGWVDGINRAARSGGVTGAQRFLGGFADGGVLGRLGKLASTARKKASDAISGVTDFVRDPAGTLRGIADKVISLVPGKDSTFGKLVTGMPRKAVKTVIDKVSGFFRGGEDGGNGVFGPSPLGGSGGMMRLLRQTFPGLKLISGYRPGSVTLSGNRSYHSTNRAVDVPPIRAVAEHIYQKFRSVTKELITPWQEFNLHNGKKHTYTGAVWRQHNFDGGNAHDHWAARLGGIVPSLRARLFASGGVVPSLRARLFDSGGQAKADDRRQPWPSMPARLFDSGGDWPSGTLGVNLSGRTEHVTTGASMDKVADLLAGVRDDLAGLADAVSRVAPGVGEAINGVGTKALHNARTL